MVLTPEKVMNDTSDDNNAKQKKSQLSFLVHEEENFFYKLRYY